jgi:hypothetical protein
MGLLQQIRCGVSASIGVNGMFTSMKRSSKFYAGIKVFVSFHNFTQNVVTDHSLDTSFSEIATV